MGSLGLPFGEDLKRREAAQQATVAALLIVAADQHHFGLAHAQLDRHLACSTAGRSVHEASLRRAAAESIVRSMGERLED